MTVTVNSKFSISAGDYRFSYLNSGDICEINHHNMMINQWISNPVDGSLNNLYLRLHRAEGIQSFPLLGVQSDSEVEFSESHVTWKGAVEDVQYQVNFYLSEQGIWFWDVNLDGYGIEADIIYGQDVGIADKGAVRNNEAYLAQYIDHTVFEDEHKGYVVCSRQNQQQSGGYPYLQQGSLTKAAGFSTDGFQFFGLSYKETNEPEILSKESLPNDIYQYEFAYTGLQSERVKLNGPAQFLFYGLVKADYPTAVTSLKYGDEVEEAWKKVRMQRADNCRSLGNLKRPEKFGAPLNTSSLTKEEVNHYFPNRHQEEWDGDTLLSFFTHNHEHVVLKEKELQVERPHGHILMTGQNDKMTENTMTSTSFMYGIFNSQLVVGNTSFNKMLTNARNALNIMKTSGQRIYVKINGVYRLLTLPSLFEIGFNYTRWFYKTTNETFIITNFTATHTPEIQLHVRSESGKAYHYVVTNQVTMNNNEHEVPFHMEQNGAVFTFHAASSSDSASIYPDLSYRFSVDGAEATLKDERNILENTEKGTASLVILELSETNEWALKMQGLLNGEEYSSEMLDEAVEIESYREFLRKMMNGFQLSQHNNIPAELEKVNSLAWWYTHNMLVHYSVPHGLEQYGGAAWGTRDVCQGPTEYFMATQNYDAVREIIKKVYSHQFEDDGNWPQWFMFDKYAHIQAGESHGDIIVWPLKVLGDYLSVTKDFSILQEKVPYTRRGSFTLTEEPETIYSHVKKEILYITEHFLHNTHLSSYGDGDWDDTLQPANAQLKQYMVSSWTVALTYQVLRQLSKVLTEVDESGAAELASLASGVKSDFNRYILQSDVIPGFVYMEDSDNAELMLHPEDSKTGINYRLLPMTRSMISELLTPEQAETHYQVIKDKLYCPDGVRLMNRPANYTGGVSTHFKRAEQAANFGREIGLQYVHAHIRFVEAMAKLGKADEVWNGLEVINPIGIQNVVPNAERRQSNAYFSSSDGKFNTRYDAQENFDKLRNGSVSVKGGWRIYSSGPGIYMNQLISNCLGVRAEGGDLIIDPVLPETFSGLVFEYKFLDKPVTFVYHLNQPEKKIVINGEAVGTEFVSTRYRQGGFKISSKELEQKLKADDNIIDIYM